MVFTSLCSLQVHSTWRGEFQPPSRARQGPSREPPKALKSHFFKVWRSDRAEHFKPKEPFCHLAFLAALIFPFLRRQGLKTGLTVDEVVAASCMEKALMRGQKLACRRHLPRSAKHRVQAGFRLQKSD